MTFIELIITLAIITLYTTGISGTVRNIYNGWERGNAAYQTARSIEFIAKSFRNACANENGNIEEWKIIVSSVKELESYEIIEYWQDNELRALRASCVVRGETVDIIGLCKP
jgi:hypothetical protein